MKRDLLILFFLLFNLNFIFADCGNGILESGEQCDDGNYISRDGCSYSCYNETYRSSYCGDGRLFIGKEECDDKNRISGDGCSSTCNNETYYVNMCGDNVTFIGFEDCDDGNKISGDECSSTCDFEYCGDGILTPSFGEKCDDANPIVGDGCSMNCTIETYNTSMCGDGIIFPGFEQCDDGNKISNDGCSNNCLFETCTNGVNLNVYSVTDISGSMTIKECADTRPFYCCLFNDCDIANTCINTCHGTYYQRMQFL